jgi:tetratricopeptide (TPR) repeat protein/serine/threonine protein kinase
VSVDFAKMQEIFLTAVERHRSEDWQAYLDQACGADDELRRQVNLLLQAHQEAGSLPDAAPSELDQTGAYRAQAECPGTVIGPYKLLEQIGEGGMGAVWMAEQAQPVQRKVALKLIKAGMDTRQVIARFEAERQALAVMDHPNIAKVFDGGTTETGRPFFVMELVKGVPITKYCDEHRLTLRERLELFLPACRAIQHAHQKGIIHRDVKPSNILVAPYDGRAVVKVIDFGVAKATGQRLTEKTLFTELGAVVGTLEYMSPEQAELNNQDIDTRSDIYSLGVLLYELLTGTTPLDRARLKKSAFTEMLRIIREEEPPKPSTRLSESLGTLPSISAQRQTEPAKLMRLVRGELDWIVMKTLEKDRNRRYQTANSLAGDVERYLRDEPVVACPPSALYRFRKFARRNKAPLAGAALILFFIVLLGSGFGWVVRDRAAQRAERESQVRESLNAARIFIAENSLAQARQKLAEAKARIGREHGGLGSLAAKVEAAEADLDRFQQFVHQIDQAVEAEMSFTGELTLDAAGSIGLVATPPAKARWERQRAKAVSLVLAALVRYQVLEQTDWSTTLERGFLAREQAEQIRRRTYEELLWLAEDVLARRQDHRSGQQLSSESAAQQALSYVARAETARPPTLVLYALRARCRKALGEEAAAKADSQLASKTPATLALDHYLLGQGAYQAGNRAEGFKAFEAALRLEPTHYWALLRLGHGLCDFGQGKEDFAAAAGIFSGCILKQPEHAHAYFCRANAYRKLGRYGEALADLSAAINKDRQFVAAWTSRGSLYLVLRQPDTALADFNKAIELNAQHANAWNGRGIVYCDHLHQYDKALADFNKAIELDPLHQFAWNNSGNAYLRLGQPEKAITVYNKAIELDAKYVDAWDNRGRVYSNHLHQYEKAVADFSKAIELDAGYVNVWINRGIVYCDHLDQYDKAVADFSKAIELDPKVASAWHNRGLAYASLGRLDKAIADYSKAIDLKADDAMVWNGRGSTYYRLGQHEKAIADCSKAIALKPDYADAWNNRGNAHSRLGQEEKALADLSKAIALKADFAEAWNNRGTSYYGLGQNAKALADFSKAIALKADHAEAWFNRGNAYYGLGQHAKALADFSRAIALKADLAEAWNNRGSTRFELGQHEKALADFSRAIALKADFADAWVNRGNAHFCVGQHEKALADWSKAIALKPELVQAWFNRGLAFTKLGQHNKAVADFSKGIELTKDPKAVSGLLVMRAQANQGLGRLQDALNDYQKALELQPNNAAALSSLAGLLANAVDPKLRKPHQALELAMKATTLTPKSAVSWRVLGISYYRTGDWNAAVEALDKSIEFQKDGGDAAHWFFLAMAHWKLNNKDEARKRYEQAVGWMRKHAPTDEELRRLRAEAAELLAVK